MSHKASVVIIVTCLLAVACLPPDRIDGKYLGERIRAIHQTDDQAILERVARQDHVASVRYEAAKRLTNQTVLAEIALIDPDKSVRMAAISNLTDDSVLIDLVANDKDSEIRDEAAKRVKDTSRLEKELVSKARSRRDRLAAATATNYLRSQKALSRVINSSAGLSGQIAHVGLLVYSETFQQRFPGALVKFKGRKVSQEYTGGGAMGKIEGDQGEIKVMHNGKVLEALYWSTNLPYSITVYDVFYDKKSLKKVDTGPLIRQLVEMLNTTEMEQLHDSVSYHVRFSVLALTNPDQLEAIALNDTDTRLRAAAIAQSNDQSLKSLVVDKDKSDSVRLAAISTMTDLQALIRIMGDPKLPDQIRRAATKRYNKIQ